MSAPSAHNSRTNQGYPVCSWSRLIRVGDAYRDLSVSVCLQVAACPMDAVIAVVNMHRADRLGVRC